jgi:hypothetical protein
MSDNEFDQPEWRSQEHIMHGPLAEKFLCYNWEFYILPATVLVAGRETVTVGVAEFMPMIETGMVELPDEDPSSTVGHILVYVAEAVQRKTLERRLQKLEVEAAQLREELKNRDE